MGLVLGLASTPLNNEIFFCDMLFHIRAHFGNFVCLIAIVHSVVQIVSLTC